MFTRRVILTGIVVKPLLTEKLKPKKGFQNLHLEKVCGVQITDPSLTARSDKKIIFLKKILPQKS